MVLIRVMVMGAGVRVIEGLPHHLLAKPAHSDAPSNFASPFPCPPITVHRQRILRPHPGGVPRSANDAALDGGEGKSGVGGGLEDRRTCFFFFCSPRSILRRANTDPPPRPWNPDWDSGWVLVVGKKEDTETPPP